MLRHGLLLLTVLLLLFIKYYKALLPVCLKTFHLHSYLVVLKAEQLVYNLLMQ